MDYEEHWDANMIRMWHDAKNEYAILSTYVANVDQLGLTTATNNGLNGRYKVPHLCIRGNIILTTWHNNQPQPIYKYTGGGGSGDIKVERW